MAPMQGLLSKGPTRPIGRPDIIWDVPGQGSLLTEWAETIPDLSWPASTTTYARMRHDSKLSAILKAYFLPIERCTYAVDPEGIDRAAAVDHVAANLGLPILGEKEKPRTPHAAGFKWHEHVRLACSRFVYGHMPFERWYEITGGLTWLAGLQERLPQTMAVIDVSPDGSITEVEQSTQTTPIPARNLLWYVNSREGANWAGVSLLRPCYTPWLLKHETMRVHATSIRRFGMGVPGVEAPPGGTPAQVEEARQLAAGFRVGDQAGAGMPSGFRFTLTGMTGTAPDAVGFLNFCNQEMSGSALAGIIELGQTAFGSRALGDTFLDLFLLSLQAGADAIGDNVTYGEPGMPGVAKDLVELNWGEGEPVPRIVATDVGDRHEITALAVNQLVASGAVTPDPELENYIREAWSLPAKAEPLSLPPAPGPAPGGGGGVPGVPPSPPAPESQPPAAAAGRTVRRTARAARARRPRWWPFRAAKGPGGLRRELTYAEAASGFDPAAHQQEWATALDGLMAAFRPLVADQRTAVVGQVISAVAGGHTDRLAALMVDTSPAADLLATELDAAREQAAGRMLREAQGQGVIIDPAKVKPDDGKLAKVAVARAGLAGAYLCQQAGTKAMQVAAAAVSKKTQAQDAGLSIMAFLESLSEQPLKDQLGAALSAAQMAGRVAVLAAAPASAGTAQYTASEVLDTNRCDRCLEIDGQVLGDLAAAEALYPNGGYLDCEGGLRCRGTVIALWGGEG